MQVEREREREKESSLPLIHAINYRMQHYRERKPRRHFMVETTTTTKAEVANLSLATQDVCVYMFVSARYTQKRVSFAVYLSICRYFSIKYQKC